MLISCEKCSTTYVLDDKLIPPQGAPVQCTRCGHVFLARATSAGEAGPIPDAGAPPTNRTQMFGVPGAAGPANAAAAGAAPTNKTVMFGVTGAEPAPPSPQQPAAGGLSSRTMMFGAPGAEAPPAPAPGAHGAMAAANKTMMFGVGGEAPPAPAGPVPQAAGNPRSTMMFGAPVGNNGPAQPPPPRTSNTMMFGTPAAAQGPQSQPPQGQKTSSTMMFGTPAGAQPLAPPAVPPAQQKSSSTMIFGAVPAVARAPAKGKLTESTVRVGPEDLERMMRERESPARAEGSGGLTPPEHGPAAAVQDRHNKTQLFAMTQLDGATPPAGNEAVERQNKTQLFAMSEQPEPVSQGRRSPRAAALPEPQGALPPPPGADPSILDTFPPEGQHRRKVTPDPDATVASDSTGTDPLLGEAPRASDPTNQTVIDDRPGARVELPPEVPELMTSSSGSTQPGAPVEGDPAAVLRAQVARRNRVALILIALVLCAAALGVTWKVFGKLLLSRAPPAAAVEGCEKALSQLRFDDSKAKADAVAQLLTVVATYPDYVEGHAALVTAVSLQLDDVQQRVRRIEQLVERKNSLIARYNKEKSPASWETTAQALSAQVDALIKEHKPLSEEGHDLDTRAREAYKGLETAVNRVGDPTRQARLAALRAQALFHGVSGTDQALVLSKRYETTAEGAQPDGWIDLAIPEYAANARVSEELMQQAMAKLDELHKRDSTFLRTYVLSARLHLIKKELEAATTDLDQVLSMRKDHDVAQELREWVRKLPKTDEKKEAPP